MTRSRRNLLFPLAAISAYFLLPKPRKISPKRSSPSNLVSFSEPAKPPFDATATYQRFWHMAKGRDKQRLNLLYQGRENSPLDLSVSLYPQILQSSSSNPEMKVWGDRPLTPYPSLGELPSIAESPLDFLHEDITEACICIGSFNQGKLMTKWWGRNPYRPQEFWSASKFIPLIYLACQTNHHYPDLDLGNCYVTGESVDHEKVNVSLRDLAIDMFTYQQKIASSNAIAATLKRFQPQLTLEKWLKAITGNPDLVFRGRYGDRPLVPQPQLYNPQEQKVILSPDPDPPQWSCNDLSAYDLTRLISLLGWHPHLEKRSRLPYLNFPSWASLVTIMGEDTARLADLGIEALGYQNRLKSVAILSKEGDGMTELRDRTEAVYTALIHLTRDDQPPQLFTLAMTLRGVMALQPRNLDQEAINLDARMATEVTRILARILA